MSNKQGGSMLLSVIFMIIVVGAIMAMMVTLTSQSSSNQAYEVISLRAKLAAESALEQAIYEQLGSDAPVQVPSFQLGATGYDCRGSASSQSAAVSTLQLFYIIASGACGTENNDMHVVRTVEVEVIK
jgi:hypothetical protein